MKLNQKEINNIIHNNKPMPSRVNLLVGDVEIEEDYEHIESWANIQEINGSLHLYHGFSGEFSKLTNIDGFLCLEQYVRAIMPALNTVGNGLFLMENANLTSPQLISVGGTIEIDQYSHELPEGIRYLDSRDYWQAIYRAKAIADNVTASDSSKESAVIRRQTI